MSHSHRKRVYPQVQLQTGPQATVQDATYAQNFNNVNVNQATPTQQTNDPTFMTPIQQQLTKQIDETAGSLDQMQLHNVPIIDPSNGFYQEQRIQQKQVSSQVGNPRIHSNKPMNQLYPVDLLDELPARISDLNLPPPPLLIPPEKMLIQNETSNSAPEYIRSTLNAIPKTNSLLKKSGLPFALVIKPYQHLNDLNNPPPLNTDGIIVRCRRCRSYLNPFAQFMPQTRKWRCNFCRLANDLPMQFDDAMVNSSSDDLFHRYNRNEVKHGVMEYIAPREYSVRQPPPSVYAFVLDVSTNALKNGSLQVATRTLADSLDAIPNHDGQTKISILCVDHVIHFFKIPTDDEEKSIPTLFDLADLDDAYLPSPTGLLVSLSKCKEKLHSLLLQIPEIFQYNISSSFALGSALKSAFKLISAIGGKIIIVSSSLPSTGLGALKRRNEQGVLNTPKESAQLLSCQDPFYKNFPIECNKAQITIDLFVTSGEYIDIATQSNLSRYTGGQLHFYPGFTTANEMDSIKFSSEFGKHIAMDISMETVMRARGSRGIKMKQFYGHFFNRSSDLCAFSTMPRDQSYVFEVTLDEEITAEYSYIQIAVLLSLNTGERRIRVITLALPTTNSLHELFASADQLATFAYFNQRAINIAMSSSLSAAREYLKSTIINILTIYKNEIVVANTAGILPLRICANLRMLPLLMSSLVKHIGFREGIVPSDHRAAALNFLESSPIEYLVKSVYPSVYSLHDTEADFPNPINASAAHWVPYGLYLIHNTTELFLWVGGEAVDALLNDAFGIHDISQLPVGKSEIPVVKGSELNARIRNIISTVRSNMDDNSVIHPTLYIVRGPSSSEPRTNSSNRELTSLRLWVMSNMVEDNILNTESYREFLQTAKGKVNSK